MSDPAASYSRALTLQGLSALANEGRVVVNGRPLSDVGLDHAIIIDENGKDVGPVEGFVMLPGKDVCESVMASLPPGYGLRFMPLIDRQ